MKKGGQKIQDKNDLKYDTIFKQHCTNTMENKCRRDHIFSCRNAISIRTMLCNMQLTILNYGTFSGN